MARFFLERPPAGDRLSLTGREARHALRVLRLSKGDPLTLFDGSGTEYDAVLEDIRGNTATIRIHGRRNVDRESATAVTLAVAPPRAKAMSHLVRGCCELGAAALVPVRTERTELRLLESPEDARTRWVQIAVEASKQSGRSRITRIEPLTELPGLLRGASSHDLVFVASTAHDAPPLAEVLRNQGSPPASILVLVGPEGDFTPGEMDAIVGTGGRPFTLGPSILRVETAAVAALAMIRALVPEPR